MVAEPAMLEITGADWLRLIVTDLFAEAAAVQEPTTTVPQLSGSPRSVTETTTVSVPDWSALRE